MMKYIIVDDETASHEVIKDYADNLSSLSYQKSCYNAFEAIDYLSKNSVDLIFLDINMPKLTGLDFLKTLSNPPKVIITSAYQEFALEGYELNITDYLLKPFNFSRFVKAESYRPWLESADGVAYAAPVSRIIVIRGKPYCISSLYFRRKSCARSVATSRARLCPCQSHKKRRVRRPASHASNPPNERGKRPVLLAVREFPRDLDATGRRH